MTSDAGDESAADHDGLVAGEDEDWPDVRITTADGWDLAPAGEGVAVSREYHLSPGQFVAARVISDAPNSATWTLEVLEKEGIDTEDGMCWPYGAWGFKSEGEARAALALVERRIVRPPRDEHGEPLEFTAEDFERARLLRYESLPDSDPAVEPPGL